MFFGTDMDKDDKNNGNIFNSSDFSISHNLDDTYIAIKRSSQIYRSSDNKNK